MEQDKNKEDNTFSASHLPLSLTGQCLYLPHREEKHKRKVSKMVIIADLAGGWSQLQREVRQREAARGLAWPSQLEGTLFFY